MSKLTTAIADLRKDLETYGSIPLEIKWSISHGRDTYGYNICSLYVYGKKLTDCNGGGYDMVGTVIGDFVTAIFNPELLKLSERAQVDERGFSCGREITFYNKKYATERNPEGYASDCYGLYTSVDNDNRKVSINGACGTESVTTILNAIGYDLVWKDSKHFILTKLTKEA